SPPPSSSSRHRRTRSARPGSVPRFRGCRPRPLSPRTQTFGQAATPPLAARGARTGASTAFGQAATSPLAAGGRSTGASRAEAPSRSAHSFEDVGVRSAAGPGPSEDVASLASEDPSLGHEPVAAALPWRCAGHDIAALTVRSKTMANPNPPRLDPVAMAWNTVASYSSYEEAQAAVDRLSDEKFPVQNLDIVGSGLRLVERV